MDPLSLSASIAGLVSLSDLVFRAATRYVKGVIGSRKEVENLSREVKNLSVVLHHLSLVAFDLESDSADGNHGSPDSSNLKPHHLHECQQLLRRLQNKLCGKTSHLNADSGLERVVARLKWPFSSPETKEILEEVHRHKQTIDLAIAADSMNKLKLCLSRQAATTDSINNLQVSVNKILDLGSATYSEKKKNDVFDLFMKVNPHKEFDTNRRLRQNLTGLWLTEGPDFEEWYTTPASKIWLTGIPGAGKSVLAASIIEECGRRKGGDPDVAVAYFFCTYRDAKTHVFSSILSTLCAQLALQHDDAFRILETYYDELKSKHHLPAEPTTGKLIEILYQICDFFSQVHLIIDGLDECDNLVDSIVESLVDISLSQRDDTINMALVSRDEVPIRQHVESHFRPVEIEAHTEDLELYVASELEERIRSKKLRLRNLALKDEISTKLVHGAKGMFRWVACQLDHICDLPTDGARRKALETLPPTLPATYERILLRVEGRNEALKQLVKRTLLLINAPESLSIRQMCEAISIDLDSDTLFDDDIIDEQELIRSCGSLIRMSEARNTIEFAHFSVQEYLQGDCLEHPTLGTYGLSKEKTVNLLGPLCLRFLTLKNHERLPEATRAEADRVLERQRNHEPSFYQYAVVNWITLSPDMPDIQDCSVKPLFDLFNLQKTPSFCLWAIGFISSCAGHRRFIAREHDEQDLGKLTAVISGVLRPDFTPLHMAAVLGMPNLCRHLLKEGAAVGLRSRFGTPFHCAIGHVTVFAGYEMIRSATLKRLWWSAVARRQTVQLLLYEGSNPQLRLITPFKNLPVLSVPLFQTLGYSPRMYEHQLETVIHLLKVGVTVDEADSQQFQGYFRHIGLRLGIHDELFGLEKVFAKLLGALKQQAATSEPTSQLYNMTVEFAMRMKFRVSHQWIDFDTTGDSYDEDVLRSLWTSIQQNDALELTRFLKTDRSNLVKSTGIEADRPDWSSLHIAVWHQSLDVLNVLLDFGVNLNTAADDGKTPMHLCCRDKDEDALKALLKYGANTVTPDNEQKTVWHYSSEQDATRILDILVHVDEREHALQMVSNANETPICAALSRRHEKSVQILSKYCTSPGFWKGDESLFRHAAQVGSSEVVQALLDAGVKVDGVDNDSGNPLHFLTLYSTVECVDLLTQLFPADQRRQEDLRSPLELLLQKTSIDDRWGGWLNREVILALLPDSLMTAPGEVTALWSFACSECVEVAMSQLRANAWFAVVFATLIERGVPKAYEAECGKSAMAPFISFVVRQIPPLFEELFERVTNFESIGNYRSRCLDLENWESFSSIVQPLARDTTRWASVVCETDMIRLLCQAILHDDGAMITLLLDSNVDIHSRPDLFSAFDLACLPEVPISEHNFQTLLSHTSPERISHGIESLDGCGPLQFVARSPRRSTPKLRRMLQNGVDSNLPMSITNGSPLAHHIIHDSIDTAELLLDAGADPWATTDGVFDAPLSAVLRGHVSVLANIADISTARNATPYWGRTWKQVWHERTFEGGNALHLAAACGRVDCLRFYLDRGLLSDPDVRDNDLATPMHYAAMFGHSSVVVFLHSRGADIDATDRNGWTPLHLSAITQNLGSVKALMDLGANQIACKAGYTPIARAYITGNASLIHALETASEEPAPSDIPATAPLALGALINGLRGAIQMNDVSACQRLHHLGCPINIRFNDPWGLTPLGVAIKERKCLEMIQWFLDNDATVSTLFADGADALHNAVTDKTFNPILPALVVRYLEEDGAFFGPHPNLVYQAVCSGNIEGLRIIIDQLRDRFVSQTNIRQGSNHLVEQGESRVKLLDLLVNGRHPILPHSTPLHSAADQNDVDACKILIENGANIEQANGQHETALHVASASGAQDVVKYLLSCGARPSVFNSFHQTPLVRALWEGNWEVVEILANLCRSGPGADATGRNVLHCMARLEGEIPSKHHAGLFLRFLDDGLDVDRPDVDGISVAHWLMASHSAGYLRLLLNRDAHSLRLREIRLWPDVLFGESPWRLVAIANNLHLVFHALGSGEISRLLGLTTPGAHNLVCRAACWGRIEAIQRFHELGFDIFEHECDDHGVPLVAAFAHRQAEAVKCLVRNGAQIPHHLLKARSSDLDIANPDFKILQWLLAGRHLERRRLTHSTTDAPSKTENWSGPRRAQVVLKWEERKAWNESMWEYAKRRWGILLGLRGRVVKVTEFK